MDCDCRDVALLWSKQVLWTTSPGSYTPKIRTAATTISMTRPQRDFRSWSRTDTGLSQMAHESHVMSSFSLTPRLQLEGKGN